MAVPPLLLSLSFPRQLDKPKFSGESRLSTLGLQNPNFPFTVCEVRGALCMFMEISQAKTFTHSSDVYPMLPGPVLEAGNISFS